MIQLTEFTENTRVFNVQELSKILEFTPETVRKLIKSEKLKGMKIKGVLYVAEADLDEYMKGEND